VCPNCARIRGGWQERETMGHDPNPGIVALCALGWSSVYGLIGTENLCVGGSIPAPSHFATA